MNQPVAHDLISIMSLLSMTSCHVLVLVLTGKSRSRQASPAHTSSWMRERHSIPGTTARDGVHGSRGTHLPLDVFSWLQAPSEVAWGSGRERDRGWRMGRWLPPKAPPNLLSLRSRWLKRQEKKNGVAKAVALLSLCVSEMCSCF